MVKNSCRRQEWRREELQAYEAGERFRKLADARGEEPGMRPVVKKNACGIWVKNALYARGEEFLPEAGMGEENGCGCCICCLSYGGKRG
ncbi:MAG: hypothetical protein IJE66_00275 [Akkermansia sp.]|nr:hypothetical protein [Akkermansia sp.]